MRVAYEAHNWLMRYYNHILKSTENGDIAYTYLKKRGIEETIMDKFNLGYAIKDSKLTMNFLKNKGYSELDLVNRKIVNVSQNGNYFDPFFNRIVFPIEDFDGRVCSFGGRAMDEDNAIKYLNSPETRIFKKHDNLYGFYQSKEAIKEQGYAVVFEGFFDVLQGHQYGLENSLASLGTALTIEQSLLIKSITDNVIIVFDDDEAGIEASFRSATTLEQIGCNVKVGKIYDGLDPDEWFRKYKNKEEFIEKVVKTAVDRRTFYIQNKINSIDINNASQRFTLVNDMLSYIQRDNVDERTEWLKLINERLNVPTKDLMKIMRG